VGQAQDERFEFGRNGGAASPLAASACPFATDKLTMPFQEGRWLEDEHNLAQAVPGAVTNRPQFGSEDGQRELLPERDAWRVGMFTLEDTKLLPEQ
jgi:hypothetical protein